MPTIHGDGLAVDYSFKLDSSLKTTTSQFKVVGFVPDSTTSADFTVCLSGETGTMADATAAAYHAIGILQTYQSSGSDVGTVRLFGISKAVCAHSIPAGAFVMPYWGVSTSAMGGRIVQVINGTCGGYGITLTSHCVILGRALEKGVTGTVITIFLNPQMYDSILVGSLAMT